MIFDDEFIEELLENNQEALKKIKKMFVDYDKRLTDYDKVLNYGTYLEAFSFLSAFLQRVNSKATFPLLPFDQDKIYKVNFIVGVFKNQGAHLGEFDTSLFNDSTSQFAAKLGAGFIYEFSEGNLDKVQTNINELRDLISGSEVIEDNHKQHLLKRLERLQSELHKKMSDLDRFLVFVGDAGVVMGKFGKDAKPLTYRIKDIVNIVWRTQARAEELESGAPNPFLKQNNDSEE